MGQHHDLDAARAAAFCTVAWSSEPTTESSLERSVLLSLSTTLVWNFLYRDDWDADRGASTTSEQRDVLRVPRSDSTARSRSSTSLPGEQDRLVWPDAGPRDARLCMLHDELRRDLELLPFCW